MSKVLLVILDGFGEGNLHDPGNAQAKADMRFYKNLRKKYPWTLLRCTGEAVGLPEGVMGNSEVGHFTIGAGRKVFQSLAMINKSIREKSFFIEKEFLKMVKFVKKNNCSLHLFGMISDEGVHAHIDHLFALLEFLKMQSITKNVWIHCITDGRDVAERSAKEYIQKILDKTKQLGVGKIASIVGRFYAMDRDNNLERTKKAFDLMVKGKGFEEVDPLKAIDNAYKRGDETDYYLQPMILNKNGLVKKEDALIFFNFRTDRAKQITVMFTETEKFLNSKQFICFGPYSKICPVIFPMSEVKNNLGEFLSKKGLRQLRAAETEKYAHVTFFFNSQIKEPYKDEERLLIPSPKCPSYADKPEMSAYELTDKVIAKLDENFDFIVLNYANCDLVGHSGEFEKVVDCCKILDKCLEKLIPIAQKEGYEILLTADHGNCEEMKYPDGSDKPSHSMNEVPCILISEKFKNVSLKKGKGLQDIAPTILKLMKLARPKEMEGVSILDNI